MTSTESFDQLGVSTVPRVLSAGDCADIERKLAPLVSHAAGTRQLLREAWCQSLAAHLQQHPALSELLSQSPRVVQCTYFEKDLQRNWLVSLHQDLSIPVAQRVDAPGWQGWSEKEGQLFVQAPVTVLASMVAVRLHLDPCGPNDGPLKVLSGTHQYGVIDASLVANWRQRSTEHICIAQTGDVVCMRPLALHSSSKATGSSRRRVLHFVFGPSTLPDGLQWATA
ncbi:phytanoyl-CoA dioxygenase family protein [Ideonella sp.]|jgi:hypothetical protein|uniref:phytanoyl-CoA dioxygenase family protein n=1 Tax=Ideonella sp. TaxID=1929293 RepID=UPI0037C086B2